MVHTIVVVVMRCVARCVVGGRGFPVLWLIVSGRGVGRLVRGGVLSGVLLRRVRCWPPRVNRRGACGDCGNIEGVPAPEYLLWVARAPLVSLPWRGSFARACKFELGVRGRGQQARLVWGGVALEKIRNPSLRSDFTLTRTYSVAHGDAHHGEGSAMGV